MTFRTILRSALGGVLLCATMFGVAAEVTGAPADAANCSPPTITSPGSDTAVVGTAFNFTVTTCSTSPPLIKAAHLPPGLHLVNNDDGTATISGMPGTQDNGIYYLTTITVSVKSQPIATQSFVVTVDNAPVFKPQLLAKDTVHTGSAFSYQITTMYGYPQPTITTTSVLPTGVNLVDNGNGTADLTGTPGATSGGLYPITITVANGVGPPVSEAFKLFVYQPPLITSPANAVINGLIPFYPPWSFTVTYTGYPIPRLTDSGLPGFRLRNNHDGTGTITVYIYGGDYGDATTITASNEAGSTTQAFSLTFNP